MFGLFFEETLTFNQSMDKVINDFETHNNSIDSNNMNILQLLKSKCCLLVAYGMLVSHLVFLQNDCVP